LGLAALALGSGARGQGAATAALSAGQAPASANTGHVSGSITDADGALLPGAQLTLTAPDGKLTSTTSGTDGHFLFTAVPPGNLRLTINSPGFSAAVKTVSLTPGQYLELPPIALRVETFSFEVDAIVATPQQLSLEQMHVEEKQRLLGVFPNFFVSYRWDTPPLTTRQKFSLATKNALDPGNIVLVGALSGVQQAENDFPGYHQGAAGYGRRFGANYANLVVGTYMGGAILPTLFRQDPRYFYKGTGTFRQRFVYAVTRAVVARGDNGKWQPAYAGVLGDLSAGAISNIYYAPSDRQGATLTFENGFLGVAGDALNNVFEEFILRRFTPGVAKRSSVGP
jgi:hypothetical protein